MNEPETWEQFREHVDALFGGQTPRQEDEAIVLGAWLAASLPVWNAALSVSIEVSGGRVQRPWPALAARCPKLAAAGAAMRRDPKRPALSGQTQLPQRLPAAERAKVLEQTGARAMLEKLQAGGNYQTVEQIEHRRRLLLEAIRPPDPGPEPPLPSDLPEKKAGVAA